MKQNCYVELTCQERWMVVESLNRLRNRLISAGRYTDAVDKPLIKAAKVRSHRFFRWRV